MVTANALIYIKLTIFSYLIRVFIKTYMKCAKKCYQKEELINKNVNIDNKSIIENIILFEFSYVLEGEFKNYLNLREELSGIEEKILIIEEKVNRIENTKAGVFEVNALLHIPTIKDIINND